MKRNELRAAKRAQCVGWLCVCVSVYVCVSVSVCVFLCVFVRIGVGGWGVGGGATLALSPPVPPALARQALRLNLWLVPPHGCDGRICLVVLPVCLFVCLSICLSVRPSVCAHRLVRRQ
jgi:hypothetical protein